MARKNIYSDLNIRALTEPLEPYTRQIIESRLSLLGYDMDEAHHETCNVYRERAKTKVQDKLLNGKNPDFLIYKSGSDDEFYNDLLQNLKNKQRLLAIQIEEKVYKYGF